MSAKLGEKIAKEKKQLGGKMRMFGGGSPEDVVPLNAPKPPGTIIDTRHISEGERKVLDELGIDFSQSLSANGLQQALDIAAGSLKSLIEQEKENAKKFSPPEIDPSKKPLKYDVVNVTDLSREKREQVRRMLNDMTKRDIDTPVDGVVDRIYPAGFKKISSLGVEQQRVLVIVRFNKGDPGVLSALETVGPEYRVRVRIITNSKEKAVWIPRTALVRTVGGSWEVFVVSGGFAERRDVTLGISNDREAEILTGVQAGEQVLLAPDSSITGGQPIGPKVLDEVP